MTDTSWPQWMQIAWRRLVENEQPSPADARYALLLLAQAAEALAMLEEEERDEDSCLWCTHPIGELHAIDEYGCPFAVLDRIRTGDGGET